MNSILSFTLSSKSGQKKDVVNVCLMQSENKVFHFHGVAMVESEKWGAWCSKYKEDWDTWCFTLNLN